MPSNFTLFLLSVVFAMVILPILMVWLVNEHPLLKLFICILSFVNVGLHTYNYLNQDKP